MIEIAVERGSIADADADVLVNASNTVLRLGSGVSGALRAACGPGFQAQLDALLRERGALEPGDVVVTDAGSHARARWIAHVAVMDYRDGPGIEPRPTLARIERGARLLWQAIEELDAPSLSVAMVALGAGTGGLGLRDTVGIACTTLREHLASRSSKIARVTFVAWELHEHVNTLAVVASHFPLDLSGLDPELRALVKA